MVHVTKFWWLFFILLLFAFSSCSKQAKVNTRLVASGLDTYTADVSPDGRLITDINWDTGTLEVRNIETGAVETLIDQGYGDNGYCWMSAFSNSGKEIAYEWFNYQTNSHELRLFSREDSTSRVLIPAQPEVLYWEPLDWSPDDENILLANRDADKNWKLVIYSIPQANSKDLIQLDWQAPGGMHPQGYPKAKWSPDNTFIAYDYMSMDGNTWDIYLVDANTGEQHTLFEDAYANRVLSWNETGDELIFYSNRSGKPAIWKQKIESGNPSGNPELIVEEIYGATSLGWANGGLFVATPVKNEKTYLAKVDLSKGRLTESPEPVDTRANYRNLIGNWSAEEDILLTANFGSSPDYKESLSIQNVRQGKTENINLPSNFHIKSGSMVFNGPDTVLILGHTPETSGLHIFDLKSRTVSMPFNYGDMNELLKFTFDEKGDKLYHEVRGGNGGIREVDLNTGASDIIYSDNVYRGSLAIDSEGKLLGFLSVGNSRDTILVQTLNLESGNVKTIFKDKGTNIRPPLAWFPTGHRLVFSYIQEDKRGLMMTDFTESGESTHTFFEAPMAFGNTIGFSATGTYSTFQSREGETRIVHVRL